MLFDPPQGIVCLSKLQFLFDKLNNIKLVELNYINFVEQIIIILRFNKHMEIDCNIRDLNVDRIGH